MNICLTFISRMLWVLAMILNISNCFIKYEKLFLKITNI